MPSEVKVSDWLLLALILLFFFVLTVRYLSHPSTSYIFPSQQGYEGEVLTNDGYGNLTWRKP